MLTLSRYFLLCCFVLCANAAISQKAPAQQKAPVQQKKPVPKKLTKKDFIRDSIEIMRPKLVRPQLRVDNRQLLFKGQPIAMNGVDGGVMLKNKLRLTVGYRWFSNNLDYFRQTIDEVKIDRQLTMQYGDFNTEFIYKNTRFFSLGMPLEFGFGHNALVYKDEFNETYSDRKSGFVAITNFGLSATFKPIRWIGIKGILGYQKTLYNGIKSFHFDGFFTSLGINVDFQEIIRDCRMFNLQRKHKRGNNISNAVDLITD